MTPPTEGGDLSIGRFVGQVRGNAGLTQAQLAEKVTFSAATLSRIESGDKDASSDELKALLDAIGTVEADELAKYLGQEWDCVSRPAFDHPSRPSLWDANLALRKLRQLGNDPDVTAIFFRHSRLFEDLIGRAVAFLAAREHQVACIGSIGVGKSTAICRLVGLVKPEEPKFDRQIVLETGAGGITLCEVGIMHGPRWGLRIVPRTEDSIRQDVEDLSDYLIAKTRGEAVATSDDDRDHLGVSREVVRAIRNMSGLTPQRREQDGRRVRIDPAERLAREFDNADELSVQILTRMDLPRRSRREAWYPEDDRRAPTHWLQQLFCEVNNGRHPEFALPQKIEVIVPEPLLQSNDFQIRIIDTKGIDQTAEREDLECLFDDPRTMIVLCSRFNDAPEIALQDLLIRARETARPDIERRTALLVLARPDEALAVKHDDGMQVEDDAEGYELKREQIELRLSQEGLSAIPVEFYNARDETSEALRCHLLGRIRDYRRSYEEELSALAREVDRLLENRASEQIHLVFDHVRDDLGTWLSQHRAIELTGTGVEDSLITAIDNTRYASTVRATVRRYGNWDNLDYYHHLSFGARKLAVAQIGSKIQEFKVVVNNLAGNPDLEPAHEFLQRVMSRLDAAVDEAYRRLQMAGRVSFKQILEEEYEFWSLCQGRWGQGSGYLNDIRSYTDDKLERCRDGVQRLVASMQAEWQRIVDLLEDLLKESEQAAGPNAFA